MQDSILDETKKALGITPEETSFDDQLIMHINSVLFIVKQLGVGDKEFILEDAENTWDDFLGMDDENKKIVKSFVYLRVRLLFDPPMSSYTTTSMENMANEFAWRLEISHKQETR